MIYFVQADVIGRVKIGYSSYANHHKRVANLQTASPVKLRVLLTLNGGREREARLHAKFAADRIQGEWFAPSKRLMEFIFRRVNRFETRGSHRPERRSTKAATWLVERFREKREWPSGELFDRASRDGVSRMAIFEAKDQLQLPKSRKTQTEDNVSQWTWWVPENWQPLSLSVN